MNKNQTLLEPAFSQVIIPVMATCHEHLSILTLISILLCFSPSSSSSPSSTFKLSLKQRIAVPSEEGELKPNQHPLFRTINYHVSASLARAHRLKNPTTNSSASSSVSEISLRGNGGYHSVSLNFGSPAQNLSFLMDTGSSLVWFPCTDRYTCYNCRDKQAKIPVFMPDRSSSSKIVGCDDKECKLGIPRDTTQCDAKQNCSYEQLYGSGSTSGVLLSETLHFPEGDVTDFAVGCSVLSSRPPVGIVGFGPRPNSLPAQMGLKKFAYCLVSHQFEAKKTLSSELLLFRDSSKSDAGISYTNFGKNPSNFQGYYYLNLLKITVGGNEVKIPDGFLVPRSDGNGGTIIDSGTTFTIMDGPAYDLVAKEFENQVSKYKRASDVELQTGLRPCYETGGKSPEFPELTFHFEGGAKLSPPMADYFLTLEDLSCMTLLSSDSVGLDMSRGPSIIMGNTQQQDIYIEYDLENGRLGFKNKICN